MQRSLVSDPLILRVSMLESRGHSAGGLPDLPGRGRSGQGRLVVASRVRQVAGPPRVAHSGRSGATGGAAPSSFGPAPPGLLDACNALVPLRITTGVPPFGRPRSVRSCDRSRSEAVSSSSLRPKVFGRMSRSFGMSCRTFSRGYRPGSTGVGGIAILVLGTVRHLSRKHVA